MIKRKSVAFNFLDPDQRELFEHANERTNFSAYVKRLIQRDLERGKIEQTREEPTWNFEDEQIHISDFL